ncbi:hypothetical protein BXZ70DRAFT_330620 [Cristinia sonorae]|uniref:VWFA domain-containing protein n=1 Tax=Cristinia sonorae TaxID=1940300 RepID=A0A8K0XNE6_9AGAR|nr:hypothetical protein BXZ70DRAFT_330620 [Cristinia sonorae]
MGNAQSNRSGRYSTASSSSGGRLLSSRISTPHSLSSSSFSASPPVRRRASAHPAGSTPRHDSESAPSPREQTHRRARSALAATSTSIRNRDTAPPPTYSVAIADNSYLSPPPTEVTSPVTIRPSPSLSSPESEAPRPSPGSSHTRFYNMPSPDSIPSELGPSTAPISRSEIERRTFDQSLLDGENPLLLLEEYDIVFVVDDSASMRGQKWVEACNALKLLADVATQYDKDGIDVCFFSEKKVGQNRKTSADLDALFDHVQPKGLSVMAKRLESLLLYYLETLEKAKKEAEEGKPDHLKMVKKVLYIVITDGAPTDSPEEVIVAAARRLDRGNFDQGQVGIQIIQIGYNPDAQAYLKMLDNDIASKYGCRDIVDTIQYSFTGEPLERRALAKILLGGINKLVDRIELHTE